MIRILITLPLVYFLLYIVRLPFVLLGDRADTWWGSIVAAFGMMPGVGLIYLVHQFQQFGFGMFSAERNPERERGGPFLPLLGFLAFLYFFYLLRGPAILVGLQGPFEGAIQMARPFIDWLFDLPKLFKEHLP